MIAAAKAVGQLDMAQQPRFTPRTLVDSHAPGEMPTLPRTGDVTRPHNGAENRDRSPHAPSVGLDQPGALERSDSLEGMS